MFRQKSSFLPRPVPRYPEENRKDTLMAEWLAVITITVFAVISPGPDFAMVSRNELLPVSWTRR